MNTTHRKTTIFKLVTIAYLSLTFAQSSHGATISTGELLDTESRNQRISDIQLVLARDDVSRQLARYGVSSNDISQRLHNLTDQEIAELEASIDSQVAGGDALGIIGAVFLVLIILEIVGITDIFKRA